MKRFNVFENEEVCANCKHYHQHYGKSGERIFEINAGHCCYPRIKSRKPGCEGCGYFKVRR